MKLQERINAFVKLGEFLSQFSRNDVKRNDDIEKNDLFFDGFNHQIKLAHQHNGWFTLDNIYYALENWSKCLTYSNLNNWTSNYNLTINEAKIIAVIMAGNIPLVGFHDVLSVLISGHNCIIKQSSNDRHILPFLIKYIEYIEPKFKGKVVFTEEKLTDYDAVIATGSNNTARYFEYYFRDKPAIIRKNRNSVAIITGEEKPEDLKALSEDIFRYYGLGCRSVSKLYVPQDYDFNDFFNAIYHWHPIIHETKYANNYDYNKAVYLMSEFDMLENGFLMLKKDKSMGSPIATLFYEAYDDINQLKSHLTEYKENIQCVVSKGILDNEIPFGQTQLPQLTDYADNVDTVDFLLKL